MLGPAMLAVGLRDFVAARAFSQSFVFFAIVTLLISLATRSYKPSSIIRSHLIGLLSAFTILPLIFAFPFYATLPRVGFLNAWFEMISSFTTTGATLFESSTQLSQTLHFWRAIVGWLGGLLVWITAVAIFAPLSLGGFEVKGASALGQGSWFSQISRITDPSERLARYALKLAPTYIGLTIALWVGLTIAGDSSFVAACHAMSVMATSGISPIGGLGNAQSGFIGEVLIFGFLIFALSRLTYSRGLLGEDRGRLIRDPEIRFALVLLVTVPSLLFLRHWFSATNSGDADTFVSALSALWGSLFTVMSFVTTNGFESQSWDIATDWSGLKAPGMVLIGLSLIGGGIATSSGGVKLLRVYALYKHGLREVQKLIHPHSIGGAGRDARQIRKQGATIAWVFFMLFALSIAAIMVLLSLTGLRFESAIVLAAAALSTNGPLINVAAETPITLSGIPDLAKMVLAGAMVLGRLETLAIIALLNPEVWRR
ncbi:TrkH family potassium uptake protein [Aestuariibius sp. HNIBRBA575]|uniref:TrkH family potassium uptake protein n=1 Tax=Aestuariibius sp. HNIBRBA575 TaxID=3233343 RepID=UPI0034A0FDB3